MEEREQASESKSLALIQKFAERFRSIDYTMHPSDIPSEAAGKGSNMAWAARKLSAKYAVAVRKDVLVTGLDGMLNLPDLFSLNLCATDHCFRLQLIVIYRLTTSPT